MENLERPNYYAIIPADVRYAPNITANAKLLYAEVTALANKTGTCWASNAYFAELYGVSTKTVSDWVAQLIGAGFITSEINKAAGNRRYIRICVDPIHKNVHTYTQKGYDINNKTNTNNNIGDLEQEKSDLLALVNKVTGRNFRTLPERGVKKTLKAFSLAEIEAALRALVKDDWHKPKIKELSIDYFIRSTTIDRFVQHAPAQAQPTDGKTRAQREAEEEAEMEKFRRKAQQELDDAAN